MKAPERKHLAIQAFRHFPAFCRCVPCGGEYAIAARKWNLIVVEDSGRLFRHETACGQLIESAFDNGIRVIAINDDVDTADEDWEDPLHQAMRHHAKANRYTSKRIKRAHDGLFRSGAAIGLLKPGYLRKPSHPATQHEPEQGPFFDELDPTWTHVILEAYERIARKEPAWFVGEWLTKVGLPKCGNCLSNAWSDKNVIAMIRRTVYRGFEPFRDTVVKKKYGSGQHKQIPNERDLVVTREMPHLRIVSDALWYAANDVIDGRNMRKNRPTGLDHPKTGIPRDSHGPLSQIFFCRCGAKMHMDGRGTGGYRCSAAPSGSCWNKATALRALAHSKIGATIADRLIASDGIIETLIDRVRRAMQDGEPFKKRDDELRKEETELTDICDRLTHLIEKAKEKSVDRLMKRLQSREAELARVTAEREWLKTQQTTISSLPTKEQIAVKLQEVGKKILDMDREAGCLLRQFVSRITAFPCRQFGSNKVVLRARIQMQLASLLPAHLTAFFKGESANAIPILTPVEITVDLFDPSNGPKHFVRALALSEAGITLEQIGKELGISKRAAHVAVQFGRDMKEAGLTDPFIELTEAPQEASRWRFQRRYRASG